MTSSESRNNLASLFLTVLGNYRCHAASWFVGSNTMLPHCVDEALATLADGTRAGRTEYDSLNVYKYSFLGWMNDIGPSGHNP